ncbi:MAG: hypothetical protein LBD68_02555 [Zoogloeaceae bacterium]|jgi:hypothetical protein|nr:hypothetical protein [Zoogloeaceae bacterium]
MSAFSLRRSGDWLHAAARLFAQKPFLLCAAALLIFFLPKLLVVSLSKALNFPQPPYYFTPLLAQILWPFLLASMANLAVSARYSFRGVVRPALECWQPLAGLALLLLCYAFLALRLLALMDPGFIHGLSQDIVIITKPEHRAPLLRLLLLFLPFFMAQWFTPLLIVWRRCPLGKALFFNFAAIGRNWLGILLLVLLSNTLTAGVFYQIRFVSSAALRLLLACWLMLALIAFWVCLLVALYRDFFPAGEKTAHISERA